MFELFYALSRTVPSLTTEQTYSVFSQLPGQPSFTFDCELVPEGLHSEIGGNYREFLGLFIKAITGQLGCVEVEDLCP